MEQTEPNAKRDFGSFHSSNVEELIKQDELVYKSPKLSVIFEIDKYLNLNLNSKFGTNELKKTLFYLTDEFIFLNHGAFGLTFKPVVEYVNEWKKYAEEQPLRFYDRQIMPLLVDLIRLFAKKVLKCKPSELVLVDNCTFAFNSVLNSIKLNKGDKVFIYSTTYGVYKKILKSVCDQSGAVLIEEQIIFPISDENDLEKKTLEKLKNVLEQDVSDKRLKYILIDHIPSNQPFLMPILKLSKYTKTMRPDILFIVDAAHSLGSVKNFNLEYIDILFTNCHKWFCGPKGTGLLYVNENVKNNNFIIRPSVHSHGINSGFSSEFIWTGLKDYSIYLGLYSNLDLWFNCFGGFDKPIDYCTNLIRQASVYLKETWSTGYLVDPNLCSTMVCVRLPDKFVLNVTNFSNKSNDLNLSYDQAEMIQNFLYHSYKIEVPIKCIQNKLYVRISAHIYNKIEDYEILCNVVMKNC